MEGRKGRGRKWRGGSGGCEVEVQGGGKRNEVLRRDIGGTMYREELQGRGVQGENNWRKQHRGGKDGTGK